MNKENLNQAIKDIRYEKESKLQLTQSFCQMLSGQQINNSHRTESQGLEQREVAEIFFTYTFLAKTSK